MEFKCKMCGANIYPRENENVITCEYCGTVQTLPSITKSEKLLAMHNRGNILRLNGEFDEAKIVYENIILEDSNDAEAHFCLLLSKYGIEYVDDPKTLKKIPTCHRTLQKSIFEDVDYLAAINLSDVLARDIYINEAKKIDAIQKEILKISKAFKSYDVFICYKETNPDGTITKDSVIACNIYTKLTSKGYSVFYAKVSLEDKIGIEYEPLIYHALSTCKIMIVIGSKQEYFNSTWVKNEWTRFLHMMEEDHSKIIIPCFIDTDVTSLPKELAKIQSLDLNKPTSLNDLTKTVEEYFQKKTDKVNNQNISAYLKRIEILISDKEISKATKLIEELLKIDPTNSQAYIYLLMVKLEISKEKELETTSCDFQELSEFKNAFKFADEEQKEKLVCYKNNNTYYRATLLMNNLQYAEAIKLFKSLNGYKDSNLKLEQCEKYYKNYEDKYIKAKKLYETNKEKELKEACEIFKTIKAYKDCEYLANKIIYMLEERKSKIKKIFACAIITTLIIALTVFIYIKDAQSAKNTFDEIKFGLPEILGVIATLFFIALIIKKIMTNSITTFALCCMVCDMLTIMFLLIGSCTRVNSCNDSPSLIGIKSILILIEGVVSFFLLAFSKTE